MGSTVRKPGQCSALTMGKCLQICKIVSACTGLVFIILGASLKWAIFPSVVDSMVKSTLQLNPNNTDTWEAWKEPPIKPYMKFTFFNVENVDQVRDGSAKPNVTEIGPFAYKEVRRKENILSIQDEISFGSYIHYEFDQAESCETCNIDTEVTVINPVMVIVSTLVEDAGKISWPDITFNVTYEGTVIPFTLNIWDDIIDGIMVSALDGLIKCETPTAIENGLCDDIVLTGTPDKMIFQGVDSGILKSLWFFLTDPTEGLPSLLHVLISALYPGADIPAETIEAIIEQLLGSLPLPPLIDLEAGTFGFFKGSNATKSWWKINSGKNSMDNYNQVLEFNGMTELPESWWGDFGPTPSADKSGLPGVCRDIIGTDGMAYSPNIDKDTDVWLFNDQLCRSIWLSFKQEVNIQGIKTYQFSPSPDVFSMSNPNNYCYCPTVRDCAIAVPENDTWDMSECNECIDGLLSLQGCQGAPVIMSTPHFLDADPALALAIDGIKPVKEKHVTYLNLEPMTGMPLQAHKRIQISVPLRPSTHFTCMTDARENVFPLVWVDEGADIDDENIKKAKKMLVTPFLAVDIGVGVMIGAGGILVIAVILHSIFGK